MGAGLAEPYPVSWCAVEYFEASGAILTMLLQHLISPNTPHCGRTLVHHAILCRNKAALDVLLKCGADTETELPEAILSLTATDSSPPDQELEAPETPAKCSESGRNLQAFENVDGSDEEDESTPLMQEAKGGHVGTCEVLIPEVVMTDFENAEKIAVEGAILNDMARKVVVEGEHVKKHTKCGKGSPHGKMLRMVEMSGVLSWGKSGRRNVICRHADVGPTPSFRWNRRRKSDNDEPGIFHVVTTRNKEVHFVCPGGEAAARLWVRGIKILTREAIFGGSD